MGIRDNRSVAQRVLDRVGGTAGYELRGAVEHIRRLREEGWDFAWAAPPGVRPLDAPATALAAESALRGLLDNTTDPLAAGVAVQEVLKKRPDLRIVSVPFDLDLDLVDENQITDFQSLRTLVAVQRHIARSRAVARPVAAAVSVPVSVPVPVPASVAGRPAVSNLTGRVRDGWSDEEIELVARLRGEGLTWNEIAARRNAAYPNLSARTGESVRVRLRALNSERAQTGIAPVVTPIPKSRLGFFWTAQEEAALLAAGAMEPNLSKKGAWARVAARLRDAIPDAPVRTTDAISMRYNRLKRMGMATVLRTELEGLKAQAA